MTLAIQIETTGAPEVLQSADLPLPDPGPGEIRISQHAIGLNFLDTYQRAGLYPLSLPAVIGVEAAGEILAVGSGVEGLTVGQRIAYAGAVGAYAAERLLPAWRAIPLPADLADDIAAVAFTRGITAEMLLSLVYPVTAGTTVLVHAAAGGLGSLLCAWAKRRGARVIGTVGSPEKAELARAAGADAVIIGRDADFGTEVRAVTGGRGVDVAYDGIGGSTLPKTFDCVRPFGTVVSVGQAGGPIPPITVTELGPRRSLSLARPSVMLFMSDPERYRQGATAVLESLRAGLLPRLGQRYPLREAAAAHRDLETGKTAGSPILIP
jgi:NADPH2:quinone reductase